MITFVVSDGNVAVGKKWEIMTKEEYKNAIRVLEVELENNRRTLAESYAMSNNPYKVGDIIEDHYHIIEIQKIKWDGRTSDPSCLYSGIELKKDLTPKIRQSDNCMYKSNVERKLKR